MLESAEQRLGVRIVVRDMGSTEGRYDPKPLQCGNESTGAYRFAVVGVQHQALGIAVPLATGMRDELGGANRVEFFPFDSHFDCCKERSDQPR